MNNKTKHRDYKKVKHVMYASLAAATLAGGMGTTPIVLAEALEADVAMQNDDSNNTEKANTRPVVEIPDVLPDGKVATAQTENKVEKLEKTQQVTAAEQAKQNRGTKEKATKSAATKDKTARVGHVFTYADFSYDSAGTTITGFSSAFTSSEAYRNWDGDLTITGDDFENLVAIGVEAFGIAQNNTKKYPNLKKVVLQGLPTLQHIREAAFEGTFGTGIDIESVRLVDLPMLDDIGSRAFALNSTLTTVVLEKLPVLKRFGDAGSSYCFAAGSFSEISIIGLPSLEEIGYCAFGYNPNLQTINLVDLPSLEYIAGEAFFVGVDDYNAVQNVNVGGLNPLNPDFYISNGFDGVPSGGVVTPVGVVDRDKPTADDLAVAVTFRDAINNQGWFSTPDTVWYINNKVNYQYVDQKGRPITKGTDGTPVGPQTADVRISDSVLKGSDFFTAPSAPEIAGYSNGTLEGDKTRAITSLNQPIIYRYNQDDAEAFTVYWVDSDGTVLDSKEFEGQPDEIVDLTLRDDFPGYRFQSLMSSTDASTADTGSWTSADNLIDNPDSLNYGDNAGRSYKFVYAAIGSVTYKYIDQYGAEIKQDSNGDDVTPFSIAGVKDEAYEFSGVPEIAGYGTGKYVSGDETKVIGAGDREIVYQFRKIAEPITIYRVDTDGKELQDPEEISGYVDDLVDLTPKDFDNYDFKELYGSTNSTSRLVPDLTWEHRDELIGTNFKFDENTAQSYKFVYAKRGATPDGSDKPNSGTTPDKTDTASGNENDKTPDKTNGDEIPGKLPSSGGGDKQPGKKDDSHNKAGQTNRKDSAKNTSNNGATTTNADKAKLPKSGSVKDYVVPVLGLTVLVGLFGVVAFKKKWKL
ncbi:LPXTG cell wall anchor domain-containing protein [Periweissella cryptocerci]|uniref:LPXTG cell wall anchor domain-containing protein n=1 Tax=Periweissella cryptocerci TaxID=2506420 RepID=A0A4P6YX89_9LACO|nr:MucBP domain-containing protein [Periweissella cryptocerci]QBO37451.1 LPXTG cell wall anchor domain-containing protein [Periweissella cryptocerci]